MSTSIRNLLDAIENDDVDLVGEYVNNGQGHLDINVRDHSYYSDITPLHCAVQWNTGTAIMEFLLAKGADMEMGDDFGNTPLMDAARRPESLAHLQYLLKHGAKVNNRSHSNWTALHYACQNANVAAARILLEHGSDIHARDVGGSTPLQMAARACGEENATTCLEILLDHGADISTCDNDGRTLLHNAISGARHCANRSLVMASMSFLLDKKKIDLNATDHYGNTVLHYCMLYIGDDAPGLCCELTRMLLAHGAQIQIRNQKLQTVFHLALIKEQLQETVQLLLVQLDLYGIDRHSVLFMTDDKGLTAFQHARSKGSAQSLLEQLTHNGEDVLPCCHDLLFAKNGPGRTLTQEVQADLDRETSRNNTHQEKSLLLDYLHSFTENSLAVPDSIEHGTTAIAVCTNPLLNDFQQVLANQMLRMSLTCPAVSANAMNELPESIKLVTMGYLAPADVMKRNIKMVNPGVHDDDENHNDDEN